MLRKNHSLRRSSNPIETLEFRKLLAVTAQLDGGVLRIVGDAAAAVTTTSKARTATTTATAGLATTTTMKTTTSSTTDWIAFRRSPVCESRADIAGHRQVDLSFVDAPRTSDS
jgi:hypothetical protein